MRILALSILFAGIFFFMNREGEVVSTPEKIDAIKVKASAPHRLERKPLAVEAKAIPEVQEVPADVISEERTAEAVATEETDMEHVEQFDDLEQGWNNELKEMLLRLEPIDGEEIHKNYISEQESYQAEMESLLNEKQQKTTPEATIEVDELINQLDEKHQTRLKDILGAHYDAVKDGLENYMRDAHPED